MTSRTSFGDAGARASGSGTRRRRRSCCASRPSSRPVTAGRWKRITGGRRGNRINRMRTNRTEDERTLMSTHATSSCHAVACTPGSGQVGRRRGAPTRFHPSAQSSTASSWGRRRPIDSPPPSSTERVAPHRASPRHVCDRGRAREHQRAGVLEPLLDASKAASSSPKRSRPRGRSRFAGGTLVAVLARVLVVGGVHRGPVVLGFDVQELPDLREGSRARA